MGGTGGAGGDRLRVGGVVHDDVGYGVMMREMEQRIVDGFVGVNDSVKFLHKHRGVWEYGERVKAAQLTASPLLDDDLFPAAGEKAAPPTAISALTATIMGLMRWSTSLQHIRDLYSYGLVQADCRQLKLTLLPITEAALERKRRRMVELFIEGVDGVMTAYGGYGGELKDDPIILSQYVDYVKTVKRVREAEKGMRGTLVKELEGLHTLMVQYDIYDTNWVATGDQVKFDEMKDLVSGFSQGPLKDAEVKLEGKWEEMKSKVMSEIKKFELAIDQLSRAIDDNPLYSEYQWGGNVGGGAVKEILQGLEGEGRKIKELTKRTEEMQRQQVVLEETSHVFKGLLQLGDKWEKRRVFFQAVEGWKEKEKKFLLMELDRVDVAGMEGEVQAMDAVAAGYVKRGEGGVGVGVGPGGVRESERSAEVVRREAEMVRGFRADLSFYAHFLVTVRELQKIHHKIGAEAYKQSFIGWGHFKRMKDLKKVDFHQHKAAIQAKLEDWGLS